LDVDERFERHEVVLHLRLETVQHARDELMALALLADLRHPEAQSHAEHDEQPFKQPMAKRLSECRHVRVHFHARILPNRESAAVRIGRVGATRGGAEAIGTGRVQIRAARAVTHAVIARR